MKRKEFAAAIGEFELVLQKHPKHFNALRYLGFCYAVQDRLLEASEAYHAALAINPYDSTVRIHLGLIYAEQGKIEMTIEEFSRAISFNSERIDHYFQVANSLIEQGALEKALAALRNASKLRLQQAFLRYHLDRFAHDPGLCELAMSRWRKAIEISGIGNGKGAIQQGDGGERSQYELA